jgi:hypothetical protein
MNQMLEQRIANLMGDTEPMPMMMQMGGEVDAAPSAEQAVEALMMARQEAEDPTERMLTDKALQGAQIAQESELAALAQQIAAAGRGPDTTLAHLTPGEVVLPPEMMESPSFETAVENRFRELDLNPEQYVVGMGIASLNPQTGLEEFGFFKKLGKKLKKVAKVIAPAAMLIPGVGTAVGAALGGLGSLAGAGLTKIGLGGVASGIGSLASTGLSKVASLGIPGLSPVAGGATAGAGDFIGTLTGAIQNPLAGGLFGKTGSIYEGGPLPGEGLANVLGLGSGTPAQVQRELEANQAKAALAQLTDAEKEAMDPTALATLQQKAAGGVSRLGKLFNLGPFDSLVGQSTGKGGINPLLAGGIGALLGKLAFDEAKNRRGVPRTPLTTMDAMGRFNIEQEIARRMGKGDVDPREFGLMSRDTIPMLSGGRKRPEEPLKVREVRPYRGSADGLNQAPAVMMNGGMVMPMRYAEGGGVEMEEFKAMDGKINGPGTETSDDIPAMLSDGEFVMKAQAVRGAGAFDLSKGDGGIITLKPTGKESRERGTQIMYQMMDMFSNQARAS